MPERLDRVEIQLASVREPLAISWTAREEILSRLAPEQEPIDHAFRAVGASNPVQLTNEEKAQLRVVLDEWMRDLNPEKLPDDVLDLWSALITDLNDAGRGP